MRQRPKLSEPPSGDRVHPRRSGTQAVQELQPLIGNRAVTQLIEVARQPAAKTKKKPAGKPFYQEVYDAIAEEKKGMVRWKYKDYDTGKQVEGTPFGGFAIPFFRALERLAKAVEAGDKPLIKKELDALFKMDAPTSAPYFISDELGNQLVSRMIMLGLDADAAKLRAWVRDRNRGHHAHRLVRPRRAAVGDDRAARARPDARRRRTRRARTSSSSCGHSARSARRSPGSIRGRCGAIASHAGGTRSRATLSPSHRSISVYESTLEGMLGQLFTVDAAQLPGAARRGDRRARGRQGHEGPRGGQEDDRGAHQAARLLPRGRLHARGRPDRRDPLDVPRRRGRLPRRLLPEVEGARIGFTFYDDKQKEGDEKQLALGRIWRHRHNQIELLERLYGVGKANAENAAVLKQLGGLRLHNNDDWRRFLIAKFEAAQTRLGDDGKALSEVVDLLKAYLQAFTIHMPYNIEDFGDNYLTRSFPRALTGQLIHDCGVYALRIAYALSLIKDRLKLRFRFIRLPAHVGLVITGHRLPTFIAHNNDVTEIGVQELERDAHALDDARREGQEAGEAARPRRGPLPRRDRGRPLPPLRRHALPLRGAAEVQGRQQGRLLALLPARAPARHPRQGQGLRRAVPPPYLDALDDAKRIFNFKVRKFWNLDARAVWRKHEKSLRRALGAAQKGGAGRAQGLRGRRGGVSSRISTRSTSRSRTP